VDATELKRLAKEHGFPAIPVVMSSESSPQVPRFDGSLDEFWDAAKALGAKTLLLLVMQFDESDFEREVDGSDIPRSDADDNDDSFDGEKFTVDLEQASPSISKFRKHLGKDCCFVLITKGGFADVDILITEPWWDEFCDEADKAVEKWTADRDEKYGEEEAENQKKTEKLLEAVRGLISDREFCLLRTHRAKIDYAIEKFPELAKVSEFVLKPEIQRLADRIQAKGLNRKRP
jgi:hypothetical protein